MSGWKAASLFLLFAGAIFSWSVYDDYESIIEREFAGLEGQAQLAVAQISGVLRGINIALQGLVADETTELRIPPSIISQREITFLKQFPEARTVFVSDNHGRVIRAESLEGRGELEKLLNFNVSQRDYFTFHRDADERNYNLFYVSRPFKAVTNRQTVAVSMAIRGGSNEFLGVVAATLMPHVFDPVLKELLSNKLLDAAAIHNRLGDILYRLPDPDKHVGKNILSGQAFQKYLQSNTVITRYLGVTATDNVRRVLVFGRVGDTGLDIGVSGQYNKIIGEWRYYVIVKIILFIIFIGLSIALIKEFRRRQAIKDTAQRYLDVAQVMLIAFDANGNITLVNRKGCQLLGYEPWELLGKNWIQTCVPAEDREATCKAHEETLTGEATPPNRFVSQVIRKDGEVRLVGWHNSVLKDESGRTVGTLNSGEDITEQRRSEVALIAAKDAAESANAAKSRFLATMSHEIRTPMNGIIGMAQMLLEPNLEERDRQNFTRTILASSQTLLTLLNDILDLSKVEAGRAVQR